MIEFLLSFVLLLMIMAAMAVGVLGGREPISGSCGGLNKVGVGGACEICGGDTTKCEEANIDESNPSSQATTTFYDAS